VFWSNGQGRNEQIQKEGVKAMSGRVQTASAKTNKQNEDFLSGDFVSQK